MKKFVVQFLILGICLTTFLSCSSDKVTNSVNSTVDVYIAGTKGNSACYWKNNQLTLLNSTGYTNIFIFKIIVSNGDVHVLGRGESPNMIQPVYLYWKNGVLTDLNNIFSVSQNIVEYITDMYIDGADVYFCGTTEDWPNGIRSTVYWKNGVKTILSPNDGYGYTGQMLVKNNSVYIISTKGINQQSKKGYYIDTQFYDYGTDYLGLYGIYENNNNIYIYGTIDNTLTGNNYIGYYKNIITGNETTIPNIEIISKLSMDNGNLFYSTTNNKIYMNNSLLNNLFTSNYLIDFVVLNDNKYILSGTDGWLSSCFLDVNGVTSMNSASDERFQNLFVIEN
jgi:hypothetical protein